MHTLEAINRRQSIREYDPLFKLSKDEILNILLHSPDRFRESKILADWIFRAYNWQR